MDRKRFRRRQIFFGPFKSVAYAARAAFFRPQIWKTLRIIKTESSSRKGGIGFSLSSSFTRKRFGIAGKLKTGGRPPLLANKPFVSVIGPAVGRRFGFVLHRGMASGYGVTAKETAAWLPPPEPVMEMEVGVETEVV